ncbi:MAG: InlB B-repeat-containing protein [Novosphingobium sp.]|nr:InlB B-repeat-containing protein [Novosphingobium sp.]
MKKFILTILLSLLILPVVIVNVYALDFGGAVVGNYSLDPVNILEDKEYYDVRIKVDEATLSTDMTTWYNAFDSIYATPHVYYFDDPVNLLNSGILLYDDISIMHVDYDLSGASSTTIYFYDINEILVFSTTMDLLVNTMLLEMVLPIDYSTAIEGSFIFDYNANLKNNAFYDVHITVDGNNLSTDMTSWYNAFDNLYATPHVYYFEEPLTFVEDSDIVYDNIYTVFIYYDLLGSNNSYVMFFDDTDNFIDSIRMDLLSLNMRLYKVTSLSYTTFRDTSYTISYGDTTHNLPINPLLYDGIVEISLINSVLGEIPILVINEGVVSEVSPYEIMDWDIIDTYNNYFTLHDNEEIKLDVRSNGTIHINYIDNGDSIRFTYLDNYDGLLDYSIADTFTSSLLNLYFNVGLVGWTDLSINPNTWNVDIGGALDGVLRVNTVSTNSILRNNNPLVMYDNYYVRYTYAEDIGSGYIDGFESKHYFSTSGKYEFIDMAYDTNFDIVAEKGGTSFYLDDLVVINLDDYFTSPYPSIEVISHFVDIWMGLESVSLVNWYDYDDTLLKSEWVLYDLDGTPPANPSRIGYSFTGWDISYENIVVDSDITAVYDPIEYTIDFETNGGNLISSQYLNYGDSIEKPSDPTKEDYIFVGWYINESLTKSINFNTYTVVDDITLYAKWTQPIGQKIDDFLSDSDFDTSFGSTIISLLVIVFIIIIMALFKTPALILLFIGIALILLAVAMGFIPVWITVLLAIITFILLFLNFKGGGSSE